MNENDERYKGKQDLVYVEQSKLLVNHDVSHAESYLKCWQALSDLTRSSCLNYDIAINFKIET